MLELARTSEYADSNDPTENPAPDVMLSYESSLDVDAAETRPCSHTPHPAVEIGEDGERMLLHVLSGWWAEVWLLMLSVRRDGHPSIQRSGNLSFFAVRADGP